MESRIDALNGRHAREDGALREMMSRPVPDGTACREIKRRKLALKDEIARVGG